MSQFWREPNRAKVVGIRPGHDGEQQIHSTTISNGTSVIVTVPVGRVYLIFSWWAWSVATGAGSGHVGIYNTVPTLVDYLAYHRHVAAGERDSSHDLFVPIEVPAGWSIRAVTNNANVTIESWDFGISVPDT